jgi:hypothetical protein
MGKSTAFESDNKTYLNSNMPLDTHITTLTSPSTWFLSLSLQKYLQLSRWNKAKIKVHHMIKNILIMNKNVNSTQKHYSSVAQCCTDMTMVYISYLWVFSIRSMLGNGDINATANRKLKFSYTQRTVK